MKGSFPGVENDQNSDEHGEKFRQSDSEHVTHLDVVRRVYMNGLLCCCGELTASGLPAEFVCREIRKQSGQDEITESLDVMWRISRYAPVQRCSADDRNQIAVTHASWRFSGFRAKDFYLRQRSPFKPLHQYDVHAGEKWQQFQGMMVMIHIHDHTDLFW